MPNTYLRYKLEVYTALFSKTDSQRDISPLLIAKCLLFYLFMMMVMGYILVIVNVWQIL